MNTKKLRGKSPRVIRATISTVKANKIINRVTVGEYSRDPLLRDVYLQGMCDIIGGDLGWAFRRAVLTGDVKQVARFCSDGWRLIGGSSASFGTGSNMESFLNKIRRICAEAIKEIK